MALNRMRASAGASLWIALALLALLSIAGCDGGAGNGGDADPTRGGGAGPPRSPSTSRGCMSSA